jgi:hypothetical protein
MCGSSQMAQARNIMNTARLQVYRKPSRVPSIIPGVASDASIFDCACLEKVAFIIFAVRLRSVETS